MERGTAGFGEWTAKMGIQEVAKGARAVVVGDIFKTQTSCGFGVPLLLQPSRTRTRTLTPPPEDELGEAGLGNRDTLNKWADAKVENGQIDEYRAEWNSRSLDGLPGLRSARRSKREWLLLGDVVAYVKKIWQWEAFVLGVFVGWLLFGLKGKGC